MGLNAKVLGNIEEEIRQAFPKWERLIEISFLSKKMKEAYNDVLERRKGVLDW